MIRKSDEVDLNLLLHLHTIKKSINILSMIG